MALLLCRQCFAWAEPIGEQCPQCDFPLDARESDPTLEELSVAIGGIVDVLGEVRVKRTVLADRGWLYETTNGLFFVPRRLERIHHQPSDSQSVPTVVRWSVSPFRRNVRIRSRMQLEVVEHELLACDEQNEPPNLLMQNPAVFFVARQSIAGVRRGMWGWTILRTNGLTLRLKLLSDMGSFGERMHMLPRPAFEAACR